MRLEVAFSSDTQVLDLVWSQSLSLLPPGLQEPHEVLVVGAPHEPLVPEHGVELLHAGGQRDPEPLHHLVDSGGVQHPVPADVRLPHLHQEDVESPASDSVQPGPTEGLQLILPVEVKMIVVLVLVEDVGALQGGHHLLSPPGQVGGGLRGGGGGQGLRGVEGNRGGVSVIIATRVLYLYKSGPEGASRHQGLRKAGQLGRI